MIYLFGIPLLLNSMLLRCCTEEDEYNLMSCFYFTQILILLFFVLTELPRNSGQGDQYDNSLWGNLPANRSATSAASSNDPCAWDQLIIDQTDTEAWPSITLSQSQASTGGCPLDTEPGRLTSNSSTKSCCTVNMATGANSQTGHFNTNHLSNKSNSGPSATNHTGTSMLSSQIAANRSWGSGPGHSLCPSQSSVGSEGKSDSPVGGGGSRGWGSSSSSSTTNFNLNLNPNANPSAWPMLGHDGGGTLGGSSGGANIISPPQPSPNLCNQSGPLPAQTSTSTGANTNSNSSGIGSAWGNIMPSDTSEPHPSPSTNVSFSSEPQNLKTDGSNHTNKQEPPSPIRNMPGWGTTPVGLGSMGQPTTGGPQVNGEDGNSVWGDSGDSKAPSNKEAPAWDSGWGHGESGTGTSGGWGEQSRGGWGKQHTEEAPGGWDAPSSPPQDPQPSPWNRAVSTTGASEGSSDSNEPNPRRRDQSSRNNPAPLLPAQDLDPRVLCNTGWGQVPVRQHTSWDMDDTKCKNDSGTETWGSGPTTPNDTQGLSNTNMGPSPRTDPGSKNDVAGSQGASGWGGNMAVSNQSSSGWGDSPNNVKSPSGPSGWGNTPSGGPTGSLTKNGSQSWGEKPTGWDDSHMKTTSQGWGEQPKTSHSWGNSAGSNNAGEWREPDENKKSPTNPMWDGETGGWKEKPRGWGMPSSGPVIPASGGNASWGETNSQRLNGPAQSWGNKPQDGSSGTNGVETMGSWGGSGTVKQGPSWGGSKQESSAEPTGWEEPSPPSIRRKMEIDDGTSAWGDPGTCNKAVNLWDRNNPGMSQAKVNTGGNNPPGPNNNNQPTSHNHLYHGPTAPLQNHTQIPQNQGPTSGSMDPVVQHPPVPPHNRSPLMAQGKTFECSHTKTHTKLQLNNCLYGCSLQKMQIYKLAASYCEYSAVKLQTVDPLKWQMLT